MSEKKYTAEMADAYLQKRREEEAAKERKRRERFEKESARKAWTEDGGAEADFERLWPSMRDEARARRVADADRRAREAQRAGLRSAF
jgi:hypothetical protein